MSKNKAVGDNGEDIAAAYLKIKGYQILERNWRHSRAEVDIICKQGKQIIFVEVKTRSSTYFGNPEEAVKEAKQKQMISAAQAYIEQVNHEGEIRFDIVSIKLTKPELEIVHFEDAFFPYQQ